MSSGTFTAPLYLTTGGSPASLIPAQITGNVGVCLSGGGSRAFSAGLGQLQALETLQANGASLLSQVATLATVSGGGWIGIPFTYLPSQFADATFLGAYTPPASFTYGGLTTPPTGIGATINNGFSIPAIALTALHLGVFESVPWNMVWQTIMGATFLQPFDLYTAGTDQAPTDLFSYNAATLASDVTGSNPTLASSMTDLVAQPAGQRRPYLLSLCGLSVSVNGTPHLLAPVTSTPIVTGVLSTPPSATDANGRAVGGGGIASFAFNSTPTAVSGASATVQQSRQWSLTDVVGTSSSAFAQALIQQFNSWKLNPTLFEAQRRVHAPAVLNKLTSAGLLRNPISLLSTPPGVASPLTPATLAALPTAVEDLVPLYDYWSPAPVPVGQTVNPTHFTDGGSLENSGIAPTLAYSNVTTIIAFINSEQPLVQATGQPVQVDDAIPPLFGFQPFANGGYAAYGPNQPNTPANAPFQFSQVFPASAFDALLQGLWAASGSGQHSSAAIFTQNLTTVANSWFGVPANRNVTVVWVYLNYDSAWYDQIGDFAVKLAVDTTVALDSFPNYKTINTGLDAFEVNLLSNFTSWVVQTNAATFTNLF